MEFRLLGPVELWAHGEQIPFPTPKVRQLYAALLWDCGKLVSTSTLIQRVWGEDAPSKELASLQANASKLRRCLDQCGDPGLTLTQISMGYRLAVPAESIDRVQFERTASLAAGAAERGETGEAIRLLRSAEALVRGEEPLAGLVGEWAAQMRAELEEQIRDVTVRRITLQLSTGDTHAVLPELRRLAAKHEYDEAILSLLMRALRSVGRTTDALDAFTLLQTRLREKGLEPRAPLKRLHQELLRDDASPGRNAKAPAPTPSAAPDTLDRDPAGFVGRRRDIDAITAEINSQLATGAPVICAIDGMPGIGKTTLATLLAHRLRGLCPDGALQLHLRAHDEHQSPTDPETALGLLLGMLNVEPVRIQQAGGLDYLLALWRKATAGKRLLLLLDDAANAEQITPLVPSGAGNIVLVTSRNRLSGIPEAIRHPLEPMPDADAGELLIGAARMSPTSDPALRDVVAACGGVPFALAVAGNTLRTRQAWSLDDLAEHLASTRNAHPRKPDSIIGPLFRVFSTSYRDLPEPERVLLRRLSLSPGPRIHFRAAAALADTDPGDTDLALLNLVEKSLLMEPERRYYQLHDMMRAFGAYACDIEEDPAQLEAAVERLVCYTLDTVEAASRLFHPHRHVVLIDRAENRDSRHAHGFSDARQATAWLDAEQPWLRITAEHWFANGRPREAAALVHMISKFMDRRSLWKESLALHENALNTWRDHEYAVGQGFALTDLAMAHWRLGELDPALRFANEALDLWSNLGDLSGQADALLYLGRVYHSGYSKAEAIEYFRRCMTLRKAAKDDHGRAIALYHLGAALFDHGDHRAGIGYTQQALAAVRVARDELVECDCINNLGAFYEHLGEYEEAEAYYRKALSLVQRMGNRVNIGTILINLAEIQTRLNRPGAALPLLERAQEIFHGTDNKYIQAYILVTQARAEAHLGHSHSARALLDHADLVMEQLGNLQLAAQILLIRGDMGAADKAYQAAVSYYASALSHAEAAEDQLLQAEICHHMGNALSAVQDEEGARKNWSRAQRMYGDRHPEDAADLRESLRESGAA